MRLMLQHHGAKDLSDGINAAAGAVTRFYARIADQSGPGTVNPLIARIGTNAPAGATPTYNAGPPITVDYVTADNDYHDVTASMPVAAHSANPNLPHWGAFKLRRTGTTVGYLYALGNSGLAHTTHGFYLNAGKVGFQSKTDVNNTPVDSIESVGSIPIDTDVTLICAYRGTDLRVSYAIAGTETVLLAGSAVAALTPANHTITHCWVGRVPRTSFPVAMTARVGLWALGSGDALSNAEITALHAHLATL